MQEMGKQRTELQARATPAEKYRKLLELILCWELHEIPIHAMLVADTNPPPPSEILV